MKLEARNSDITFAKALAFAGLFLVSIVSAGLQSLSTYLLQRKK
jgi:hypothetical protein